MTFKKIAIAGLMALSCKAMAVDWKEADKQQHLTVSTGIATITYGVTGSPWASFGACIGAGLAKELYDKQDYGTFSADDMQANAIGCGIGMGLGYLFFGSKQGFSIRF